MFQVLFAPNLRSTTAAYSHRCVYLWKAEVVIVSSGVIHEYGTLTETITLLKPVDHETMLIPYEQLFIQAYHQTGNLVPEQNSNETNPLFQLIIDWMLPPP
jgi:hypothetical protein